MKLVILSLALLGLVLAGPILNNSQEDVRILSDGSIIISNGLGKRILIQKSLENKGNLEIVIKSGSIGLTRIIEITSPTEIFTDVVKNSANIEITANVQSKPVEGKKSKPKGPVVNGEVQLKTLQAIVREYQGIVDTNTYAELLNKISAAVNNGELNQVILEAFRSINDDHRQAASEKNEGQNPWVPQNQPGALDQTTSTLGAQNSYLKFGPGGPFGPFGPFSPYSPYWWNPNATFPSPNPWVASNPWIQTNPWISGNPWLVPQTATAGADNQETDVSTGTSLGAQNNFSLKFPAGTGPWWLATSAIDAKIKDATKFQKTALKNLQQLQTLKLTQSTALAEGATAGDSSVPQIDYDSAIQSAYDVLQYAQKSLADLSLQKQQQQLALLQQFGQPPVVGQQPVASQQSFTQVPLNQQAFLVNQESEQGSSSSVQPPSQSDPSEIVPDPFTSFKVKPFGKAAKPTKEPKTISEAPEIAQTKVAAVIQQRIQQIQDQWSQQSLISQQLLQQQATVNEQLTQLQNQVQLAKAQGASPELLNQLQLAQQDLAARQGLLVQQQLNQQAVTNGLQAQLALLNDQLKNVPNANIPEGASTWPEILGIPKKVSKSSGSVTRVPLEGGLQSFTPVF